MSGAAGAALAGIGAATSLNAILSGPASPVVLGDFAFLDMEVPAAMKWPVAQKLVVHRLPGGARVIDALGRDDGPISWSGKIMGPDADARSRRLQELCVAGAQLPLCWGTHLYTVVVERFAPEDRAFQTPYQVTVTVLRDESAEPGGAPPSLLGQVTDDINQALAVIGPVEAAVSLGAALLTSAIGVGPGAAVLAAAAAASAALATVQTTAQATQAEAQAATEPVAAGDNTAAGMTASTASLRAATGAVAAAADPALAGAAIPAGTDPALAALVLQAAALQSGAAAAALIADGFAGRIGSNLAAVAGATEAAEMFATPAPPPVIAGGSAGSTITQIGGDLYTVAAAQLGDATQWFRIAQASGLDDPMLSGTVTLTIPDAIQAPSAGDPTPPGGAIL